MNKYSVQMVDNENIKNVFSGNYWGATQHEATRDARRDFAQKLGLPTDDDSLANLRLRLKVRDCTKIQ